MKACESGDTDVVDLLLNAGSRIQTHDGGSSSVFDLGARFTVTRFCIIQMSIRSVQVDKDTLIRSCCEKDIHHGESKDLTVWEGYIFSGVTRCNV